MPVVAESVIGDVWSLESDAPFVTLVTDGSRGLFTVAVTDTLPDAPAATVPTFHVTMPALCTPPPVLLTYVTPGGSVSTIWADVAAVCPVLEYEIV
jgi:hypothetical protein